MLRRYRQLQKGEFIVIGADAAWGGVDYCTAQVLSKTNLDVPIVYHAKVLATEMTPILHSLGEEIYDQTKIKPVICIERNNGGVAELERLATLNRNGKYRIYVEKTGIGSTEETEDTMKVRPL